MSKMFSEAFSPTVQPLQSVLLLLFLGGRPAGETEQRSHGGHQSSHPYKSIHSQRYISPPTSRPVSLVTGIMAALHLGGPVSAACEPAAGCRPCLFWWRLAFLQSLCCFVGFSFFCFVLWLKQNEAVLNVISYTCDLPALASLGLWDRS